MRTTTVVVIGMHRSGTSMVSGVLEALGINMGQNFKPGSRANPLGYFEDQRFKELNRNILHAADGDMYSPPPLDAILDQRQEFKDDIQQIVNEKAAGLWGWKDPRTSLTIASYIEYLPNPHVIVCRRDTEAVANSLVTRGDMRFEEAVELAEEYDRHIKKFFATFPHIPYVDIFYEDIIRNPASRINEIIQFLDVRPSNNELKNAAALIKPKREIQMLKLVRLLEKGIRKPWRIPSYLCRRIFKYK